MEHEFVRRRGWLTPAEFLDLVGAASLIPGPSSTEVAIYVGFRRAGLRGLAVAGTCFILPAALIVTALGWAYARYGALPSAGGALRCVEPVVLAIVAQALWTFGRTALKSWSLAILGALALTLSLLGVNPVLLLAAFAGLAAALRARPKSAPLALLPLPLLAPQAIAAPAASLLKLFLVFLKAGSVVFGSGYVLLAFLRGDLVQRLGWLTEAQLVDAIAIGQITPGPVFTTATFIGYILHGPLGAAVATVGVFLPSFLLVAASAPLIPRLRRSPLASACLDGINVASLALMAAVSLQIARASIRDVVTALIALVSLVLLLKWRVNSTWLVLAGACIGLLQSAIP
jgi:chromate transporter